MRGILRFATRHPVPFVILATAAWMMIAGVAAYLTASALQSPLADELPQSLGTLAATACLLLVMARWGWLRASSVARLGSARLWLLTAGLTIFVVVAYHLAFFGETVVDLSTSTASGEAQAILRRQAVVGLVEETLFRGFLLYALVRVWGNTRRGLLAAVGVSAMVFGLIHAQELLFGNPLDETLMTILNASVEGLWYGSLVLLGGSLWPAVLIHAASNASVQIVAASLPRFDPSVSNYAVASAAELPLVIAGLGLLMRRSPGSVPPRDAESARGNASAGSTAGRVLIALSLTGVFLLAGCSSQPAAETAPAPTRTPHPPLVIPTRLTAAERRVIFDTVWRTMRDEYFDPTFGGRNWEAIGVEYRMRLATVQDDDTFWRQVLNPMLWELGVSHLVALPPELATLIDPMTFATGSPGMDVRLLDGMAVVTQVIEGSPADEAGIELGYVITSVDGWTLEDFAAYSTPSPPYNGRHERVAALQELRSLLYGETGREVVVEYLDANDLPQRVTLRYTERSGSACAELDPSTPPACGEIEVRRLANGIGYIRFSGFLGAVLDSVLQAIDELRDAPGLIIDLRGNPGGQFFVRTTIASHLVGAPELWMRYQYRDHLEEVYLDPVPDAYPGEVVILVDELSASSSEEFSGSLQALGRATIVGSQTPGVCLTANIVPLPNGGVLVYPFSQPQTSAGRVLEDNGVVPDIAVTLERQQLLQGIDAQLGAALAFLAQQIGN
jgi:carboxyl-terminal processing protease